MRILMIMTFLGLSACAGLSRDPRSGYFTEESEGAPPPNLHQQKQAGVEAEAREELGLGSRSLSDAERSAIENRIRLKRMEARLATKREKKQYYGLRSALRSDRERIQFLSLPTLEARERWAQVRGLGSQDEVYSEETARVIDGNDISLGMSQKAVMQSWGDPDAVEIAGNPLYGYERWKYNRYVSGNEGYQKEMRVVYFEGGRVVGWERL